VVTVMVGEALDERKMVGLRVGQGTNDAGLFAIDVLDNVELVHDVAHLADELEILTDIEQGVLIFAAKIEWPSATELFETGKLTDLAFALDVVPIC
jgi:hypothetical protein